MIASIEHENGITASIKSVSANTKGKPLQKRLPFSSLFIYITACIGLFKILRPVITNSYQLTQEAYCREAWSYCDSIRTREDEDGADTDCPNASAKFHISPCANTHTRSWAIPRFTRSASSRSSASFGVSSANLKAP